MATEAGAGGDVHRVLYDAVALCSASCAEMTSTNPTMKGAATPVTVRLEEAPTSPPDPPAHRLGLREPDFERPLYDLMATAHRLLTSHSHVCCHSRDGRLRGKEKPPLNCTVTGDRDLKLKLTDFKAIFTHRETIKYNMNTSKLYIYPNRLSTLFPARLSLLISDTVWPACNKTDNAFVG